MRQYDYHTVYPRDQIGSMKWNEIKRTLGTVPEGVIPFSVADMELPTAPEIADGLKQFIDKWVLGYAQPTDDYREAVVSWMHRRHGWDIEPDWIIDTHGVINALFHAVRAFTQKGDGVMLMTPVYYPMYMAIERNGRKLVDNPLIRVGDTYEIDFADFEQKAQNPDTKLLILCSPHNPTGRVWREQELRRIGEICLENHVIVVSDEIHSDLVQKGFRHIAFASLSPELRAISVTCTAPSKTFNLAGLQTSNVVIADKTLRERYWADMLKEDGNPKCNILGLEACRLAYTCGEPWLEGVMDIIRVNHDLIADFFHTKFPSVKVMRMEGTYLLWIDFSSLGLDPEELDRILKQEAWLFLDDGAIFGKAGAGFQRWNLACPTNCVTTALSRLEPVLRKYIK